MELREEGREGERGREGGIKGGREGERGREGGIKGGRREGERVRGAYYIYHSKGYFNLDTGHLSCSCG